MKANEIKAIVDSLAHEMGCVNYYNEKCKSDLAEKAEYAVGSLLHLISSMKADVKTVRSESCKYYAAAFAEIGKNKMYFRWITSCSIDADNETYEEFKKVVSDYKESGYTCYTTDGDEGMMIIERF